MTTCKSSQQKLFRPGDNVITYSKYWEKKDVYKTIIPTEVVFQIGGRGKAFLEQTKLKEFIILDMPYQK